MSDKKRILISLHKGYGVGDGVQMSAVLHHVAKYRPEWDVDYQAERGKEVVGRGIVQNVFAYGDPYPSKHYDAEVLICLYDTWANWGDRPNTRVSSALHEFFGLGWDPECGRYQVNVRPESEHAATALIHGVIQTGSTTKNDRLYIPKGEYVRRPIAKYVAIHYEGDSSPDHKNLTHGQVNEVCLEVERLGYIPLILDWRRKSPLLFRKIHTPEGWGGDAEMVCAVIQQCSAFVGIDSGPSKCASSTDVPTLVVWTGHHPAPFHDPASNTTHLVPQDYHGLEPVCNNSKVIEWFEANYNVRIYTEYSRYHSGPAEQIKYWLREMLI